MALLGFGAIEKEVLMKNTFQFNFDIIFSHNPLLVTQYAGFIPLKKYAGFMSYQWVKFGLVGQGWGCEKMSWICFICLDLYPLFK